MTRHVVSALGFAALMALGSAAQAATATFEDAVIGFLGNAESVVSGGLRFTQGGEFGGVADSETFDIFGNAPSGNATNYYAALNDSSVTMTMADASVFRLTGLRYGFVSPIGGVYAEGDEPGSLVISARSTGGATFTSTFSFGAADAMGDFSFRTLTSADLGALSTTNVSSVTFSACTLTGPFNCASPFINQNQFALDNVTAVPEPAALALALMGVGVVGLSARSARRARHARRTV